MDVLASSAQKKKKEDAQQEEKRWPDTQYDLNFRTAAPCTVKKILWALGKRYDAWKK